MESQGIIRPSRSAFISPVVPIVKKDGKIRLCVDFRNLNQHVLNDSYPLPNVNNILHNLGKGKMFSCLDLKQGYHQIQLNEESKPWTAFATSNGLYEHNVLPMGLKDSPAAFCRIINQTVGLCMGYVQAWDVPQSSPPQQGMSFSQDHQLLVTGQAYVVPFLLKLEDIYEPIKKTINITQNIIYNLNEIAGDDFIINQNMIYNLDEIEGDDFILFTSLISQHILAFQERLKNLHASMQDFLMHIVANDIPQPRRKKRGAINFIGSFANTLFGTATQDQVDIIHKRLQSLDSFTEEERKLLNVHSHVINVTLNELTNVHQTLEKLETATRVTKTLMTKMENI
ncbi:uncharacterized protein LOC123502806 [Portunus trituberculatus]|uniref:uncharacterized protein LOC123502806 n=1 Tax=Portunus trituberculatus TaxID=210409 RepID=UPI001E1D02FE|nr:uncharacterized protein LOC123502806 [Portunus trituberculatus]